MVALVVATRDSTGMGIERTGQDRLDEMRRARLAGPCPGRPAARVVSLAPSGPDRSLPEVVKPRAATAAGGVERLLRVTGVTRP